MFCCHTGQRRETGTALDQQEQAPVVDLGILPVYTKYLLNVCLEYRKLVNDGYFPLTFTFAKSKRV